MEEIERGKERRFFTFLGLKIFSKRERLHISNEKHCLFSFFLKNK
jgi:hypothetical protein